jgi:hypothetical protein
MHVYRDTKCNMQSRELIAVKWLLLAAYLRENLLFWTPRQRLHEAPQVTSAK